MVKHWGPPPGELFVDRSQDPDGEIVIAALQAGNVVLMVQPPRGFGENPVAIYHDPDLPPSHHYLAAYHWIDTVFGADAVVHLGKHGNLEWLPGKTLGMSAACGSDAALGNLPLIYPFLVNDPGEGTQAKRRAHATLVDHLIPPMARAETYGDIARLEQLLDEHANIAALDPGKLPAIRQQIWTLMRAAKMDHDLGLAERPEEDSFDDMLLHVDGWLCEIKDVQIRDGLHILGEKPTGGAELDLVLAILRARQLFGGEQTVPGLRQALGLAEDGSDERVAVDAAEEQARELVAALQNSGWDPRGVDSLTDNADVAAILRFAATEVVPRLAGTAGEIPQILRALDGRFIAGSDDHHAVRGRQRHRRNRARDRAASAGYAGPAVRGREPCRRRRLLGGAGGRARRAGRLHAADHHQLHAFGRTRPVQDRALRPDQGFHAGRAHRQLPVADRGQSRTRRIHSMQELVAYAKANPGKLCYGARQLTGHITSEALKQRTGIDLVRVPYRSNPAAMTDLIAGHIPAHGAGLRHRAAAAQGAEDPPACGHHQASAARPCRICRRCMKR